MNAARGSRDLPRCFLPQRFGWARAPLCLQSPLLSLHVSARALSLSFTAIFLLHPAGTAAQPSRAEPEYSAGGTRASASLTPGSLTAVCVRGSLYLFIYLLQFVYPGDVDSSSSCSSGVWPCCCRRRRPESRIRSRAGPRTGLRRRATVHQPVLHRRRRLWDGLVSFTCFPSKHFAFFPSF